MIVGGTLCLWACVCTDMCACMCVSTMHNVANVSNIEEFFVRLLSKKSIWKHVDKKNLMFTSTQPVVSIPNLMVARLIRSTLVWFSWPNMSIQTCWYLSTTAYTTNYTVMWSLTDPLLLLCNLLEDLKYPKHLHHLSLPNHFDTKKYFSEK